MENKIVIDVNMNMISLIFTIMQFVRDFLVMRRETLKEYFEYWGCLCKMRYLPLYVFKGSAGIGVCRLYGVLEEYINERRKDNKLYAILMELH